jgi:hypothetical protein
LVPQRGVASDDNYQKRLQIQKVFITFALRFGSCRAFQRIIPQDDRRMGSQKAGPGLPGRKTNKNLLIIIDSW